MHKHFKSIEKNFISKLIENEVDGEFVFNPILKNLKFTKEFVFGNNQDSQKYEFCKLTLVDVEDQIINCRLSIHFSQ